MAFRMTDPMAIWQQLISALGSRKKVTVTDAEIIAIVSEARAKRGGRGAWRTSDRLAISYRRLLVSAGYLVPYGNGKYKRTRTIRKNLTVGACREEALWDGDY